jgi:hypothetical protein
MTSRHRLDDLPDEGRVVTAVVGGRTGAVPRCGGRIGALEDRCPRPGYDHDPGTGRPPAGLADAPVIAVPGRVPSSELDAGTAALFAADGPALLPVRTDADPV